MTDPNVSVVIPTIGRETLLQAVESALEQTSPPGEVLVVADLERLPDAYAWSDSRVRILCTGGGRGGNVARQLGVDAARGDAIAFLDDDDYWYPEKLERQLELLQAARARGCRAVVGAAVQEVDESGRPVAILPRRTIAEGQTVTDYLFKRREIPWGEAIMSSSMLLIDRPLLDAVPLDQSLPIHQDWDWLVRASLEAKTCFLMAQDPLLVYRRQPPGGSISRGQAWRHSLVWADRHRELLSAREYGDLLFGITVSLAVTAGDRRGAWRVARRALSRGRPGLPAIVAGCAILVFPSAMFRRLSGLRGVIGRRRHAASGR